MEANNPPAILATLTCLCETKFKPDQERIRAAISKGQENSNPTADGETGSVQTTHNK